MHTRVLAERNEAAHTSILESAKAIAEKIDVPAETIEGLTNRERDPLVQQMTQREAVASLLSHISKEIQTPKTAEPIKAKAAK